MLVTPFEIAADPRFAEALALCDDVLLTSKEVAKHFRMTESNLRMMRSKGQGPPYLKLNARVVRYRMSEVLRFEIAAKVNCASLANRF